MLVKGVQECYASNSKYLVLCFWSQCTLNLGYKDNRTFFEDIAYSDLKLCVYVPLCLCVLYFVITSCEASFHFPGEWDVYISGNGIFYISKILNIKLFK